MRLPLSEFLRGSKEVFFGRAHINLCWSYRACIEFLPRSSRGLRLKEHVTPPTFRWCLLLCDGQIRNSRSNRPASALARQLARPLERKKKGRKARVLLSVPGYLKRCKHIFTRGGNINRRWQPTSPSTDGVQIMQNLQLVILMWIIIRWRTTGVCDKNVSAMERENFPSVEDKFFVQHPYCDIRYVSSKTL